MSVFVIGLNHRTAPIEVRETVAFTIEAQREAMRSLCTESHAQEALLLSTCNRTELYLRGDTIAMAAQAHAWLNRKARADIGAYLYQHEGRDAVRHLYRVASGLDSMVLGEPQILGQVKLSVRIAEEAGTLNGTLNRLLQQTFTVSKEVRTQTEIGAASVSMAATALKLARQLFGDIREIKLLLIGVGEMIELAATHFAAQHPQEIVIANRTLERGRALAQQFNARAITLNELPERIHEFDAIISSTASMLPIIGKGMLERALKLRRHKPMFLVDLAVPRDIEAEAGELDDIFLYTLDTLGNIIQQNADKRQAAVTDAEAIIEQRTTEFIHWMDGRAAVPVIQQLRNKAEQYRQAELQRAHKMLARGEDPQQVLEAFSQGLTNKFLHHPMLALSRANETEREALADSLTKLYPEQDRTEE